MRINIYPRRTVGAADIVFKSATSKIEASRGQSEKGINTNKIGGMNSAPVSAMYHALARYPIDNSVEGKSRA